MGLHLIAFSLLNPADLLLAMQVALGIGMVIFVHELGHFAVAKWCGVKCEKFYLGFDIGGWKLFKFQWGETEYGIGVLPLGGYVKMLGQEDNPSRMAEELERAKLQQAEGDAAGGQAPGFDPRSFLAKSVPQRMAIISAGVIMNVIFAFCLATYCYGALGVKQVPCTVGNVLPGEAAWRAGLRAGDKIVQIGEVKHPMFRDLQRDVNLGDNLESGVKFVVQRPGTKEPLTFKVTPDRGPDRLAPMIGITGPRTRELAKPPVSPASPLARLPDGFEPGDEIVAVNGKQVETALELEHELYNNPGAASITVNRKLNNDETKIFNIDIPAIPTRTLGLVMKFGKITAVQAGSPADQAGIQKGDRLLEIDGAPVDGEQPIDPAALPQQLAARAGETVSLVLDRGGKRIEIEAKLRKPLIDEPPLIENHPQTIPALGLAYAIENTVAAVEPDSPAAKQKIKPGDEIIQAELVPPEDAKEKFELKREPETETLEFNDEKHNYPALFYSLQGSLPGTTVKLTLKGDRKVTLAAAGRRGVAQSRTRLHPPPGIRHAEGRNAGRGLESGRRGNSRFAFARVSLSAQDHDRPGLYQRRWRSDRHRRSGRRLGLGRRLAVLDVPGHAQRQPGRHQLPAHPLARRRAHDVPGLGRRARQTGQRAGDDRLAVRRACSSWQA